MEGLNASSCELYVVRKELGWPVMRPRLGSKSTKNTPLRQETIGRWSLMVKAKTMFEHLYMDYIYLKLFHVYLRVSQARIADLCRTFLRAIGVFSWVLLILLTLSIDTSTVFEP